MARTQTLVQLTQPLLELLDRVAAERGMSRSLLVREAVAAYLDVDRRKDIDARMVTGYRRVPQSEGEARWAEARRREAWADLEW